MSTSPMPAREPVQRSARVADNALADGGGVLLHLESGSYHGLNETGWAIWELIDGRRTRSEITAELEKRLDDPPPELSDEVARLLDEMRDRRLLD